MSCVNFIMRRLGFRRPFRSSDIDEAMTENIKHCAAALKTAVDQVPTVSSKIIASNEKLRESLRQSRVSAFAEFELLVHHGEPRRAHRNFR